MRLLLLVLLLTFAGVTSAQTKIKTTGITDLAVTTAKIADNAVTTGKVALDTLTAADLAPDSVGTSELADGTVAADDLAATLDLSAKTITLPTANTPAFTKSYASTNQTITSAGTLTLAHGLGGAPTLVQVRLKCLTAEAGYSIGDEIVGPAHMNVTDADSNRGLSIKMDATNLTLRYGSAVGVFAATHGTTGVGTVLTNANWAVIVKAWR